MDKEIRQHHRTPKEIFLPLHDCFGFTLDGAATKEHALLPRFCGEGSDISTDGLKCSWAGEKIFINPPFKQLGDWIRKAYMETRKLCDVAVLVSLVAPSTKYWHLVEQADCVYLCRPRIQFLPATDTIKMNSNPRESCIIVFRRVPKGVKQYAKYITWEWKQRHGREKESLP